MCDFVKQNLRFITCLGLALLLGIALVYGFGFWKMVVKVDSLPERLRDITYPIWEQHQFTKHGLLVFFSQKDFEAGVAYSNHSYPFLFFIYMFYKIEMAIPQLPMRAVVAGLEMVTSIIILVFITLNRKQEKVGFHYGTLITLGMLYLLTLPDFWISAGKFNVDNPLHLEFPVLLLLAYRLSQGDTSGKRLWIPLIMHCLIVPMQSALLAVYLITISITKDGLNRKLFSLGVRVLSVSVICYLPPILLAKLLGFTSNNSGWLFRSGLDGQTDYFHNIVQAIVVPYFPRPVLLLVVPASLLIAQLVYKRFKANSMEGAPRIKFDGNLGMFYGVLFSQYILTCLLWPQAVSIHPYGYDFMLLAPICVWVVMNFSFSTKFQANSNFWILVMLFLISFNFQVIAQAGRCSSCYYP